MFFSVEGPPKRRGLFFFVPMFGNKERLSYLWDMNETNTHKMTSRRTFAIALSKGPVQVSQVSKKLDRVVALWLSRGEIKMDNNAFTLAS